jgi:hypothetical protein
MFGGPCSRVGMVVLSSLLQSFAEVLTPPLHPTLKLTQPMMTKRCTLCDSGGSPWSNRDCQSTLPWRASYDGAVRNVIERAAWSDVVGDRCGFRPLFGQFLYLTSGPFLRRRLRCHCPTIAHGSANRRRSRIRLTLWSAPGSLYVRWKGERSRSGTTCRRSGYQGVTGDRAAHPKWC